MSEKQQDIERKRQLGERLTEGTYSLVSSDSRQNQVLGGLRIIGQHEESGKEQGFDFKFFKKSTVVVAKLRGWTADQIEEAMEEGRNIERLRSATE